MIKSQIIIPDNKIKADLTEFVDVQFAIDLTYTL